MNKIIPFIFLVSIILLSSCKEKPAENVISEDEAKQIAKQAVINSYQYQEYEGKNLEEIRATPLKCPGCFEIEYVFDINTDYLPEKDIKYSSVLTVENGRIAEIETSEFATKEYKPKNETVGSAGEAVNEGFCGTSTSGECYSDEDCIKSGCSGQVCASKKEEQIMTICEYRDCYNSEKYNLKCKCTENKCQWS